MTDFDILYFNELKKNIQAQYLETHTPENEHISTWKGIDIVYFQEDLRKLAKGNISEKSFYTYFKSNSNGKLPRIDMLNLLAMYVGYQSWSEFKKKNPLPQELLQQKEDFTEEELKPDFTEETPTENPIEVSILPSKKEEVILDLQKTSIDNQVIINDSKNQISQQIQSNKQEKKSYLSLVKKYLWLALAVIFGTGAALLGFKDDIFGKNYTYCFTDADRGSQLKWDIEIKVIKDNESPIFYRVKPGECFHLPTKDKSLSMEISSPLYENLTVTRNLENAPKEENIELKPDDYKFALYYFSQMNVSGQSEQNLNQKRKELEARISNNAVIKQIYDSDLYGVENISKEKYITLVTTPTTSLKNLNLIEMKRDEQGKIISIKFKITDHEKN